MLSWYFYRISLIFFWCKLAFMLLLPKTYLKSISSSFFNLKQYARNKIKTIIILVSDNICCRRYALEEQNFDLVVLCAYGQLVLMYTHAYIWTYSKTECSVNIPEIILTQTLASDATRTCNSLARFIRMETRKLSGNYL